MKNRYFIEVLKYDGTSIKREIEADNILIAEGSIKFVGDLYASWDIICVYPVDRTIIYKIEKLK